MEEDATATVEYLGIHDIPHHLVEDIFRHVPLKYLTRLKCVSKTWQDYIMRHRILFPPATSTGLVFSLLNKSAAAAATKYRSAFIKLKESQNFTPIASSDHNYPYLIDSCNGLLLYGTHDNNVWTYHVCCPLLDYEVMPLPAAHPISRPACVTLSFDGFNYSDFRVISIYWEEFDINIDPGLISFAVFSSKNWDWRENRGRILNSYLIREKGFVPGHCFSPRVYSKKRIYALWSTCMLVYDDEKEFFRLTRLPTRSDTLNKSTMPNAYVYQLLWESDGIIHFCDPVEEGLNIWVYVDDYDYHCGDYNLIWRFKKLVVLSQSIEKFDGQKIFGWRRSRIRPCMFNEDLQMLYLLVPPGIIVSYSFETQKMAKVWSFLEPAGEIEWEIRNAYPFLFNCLNWADLKDLWKRGESKGFEV